MYIRTRFRVIDLECQRVLKNKLSFAVNQEVFSAIKLHANRANMENIETLIGI